MLPAALPRPGPTGMPTLLALRIVPGKTHTNVLFDLVLPAGYAGDKVELLSQLERFIKEQDASYSCIIKVEQSYTAAHQS